MKIIGITGLICSGKSTLSKYLLTKNYKVFDADYEVKKLYENKNFLDNLKNIFPECFKNNILNKELLSNLVFNNLEKKKILENIIHPIIEKKCDLFIKNNQNEKIIFIDVPLLFEIGWNKKCNDVILVILKKNIQKERFIKRNRDSNLFDKILNNQGNIEYKKQHSKYIIENNKTLDYFYNKIDNILEVIN